MNTKSLEGPMLNTFTCYYSSTSAITKYFNIWLISKKLLSISEGGHWMNRTICCNDQFVDKGMEPVSLGQCPTVSKAGLFDLSPWFYESAKPPPPPHQPTPLLNKTNVAAYEVNGIQDMLQHLVDVFFGC